MKERNFEHKRMRIPDEDAPAWMHTLREGGFNDGEIDMIMAHCNAAYFELKKPNMVEREVEKIKESFLIKYGKVLNEGETEYVRKFVEQQFDKQTP